VVSILVKDLTELPHLIEDTLIKVSKIRSREKKKEIPYLLTHTL
jgi:hypothetical protein